MKIPEMLQTSKKLLCDCGCGVPLVLIVENRLIFRKRVHGVWHDLTIVLPGDTKLDGLIEKV